MRILALIPARGGSKRLPGKNIRLLGGKPLIVWSIEVARGIPEICDTLISTDSPEIANTCIEAGTLVPWLRPQDLATDDSSSVSVALHALDKYETEKGSVDGLLLLQPTSPFRTKDTVKRGIELFRQNPESAVLGVSEPSSHPMWSLKVTDGYLTPYMQEHGLNMRSQDLPKAFVVNGSFYLIAPSILREQASFVGTKAIPLIVNSPREVLDIDTEWDFKLAELTLNA
jgi:N-acylneuraminate cytidylyltransferase